MQDVVRPIVRQRTRRADPITVEVIGNALAAIAEEMTVNLARTAHSTIVYEVQDFCTGLLDAAGRLVAQPGAGLPLFVGDLDAAIGDGIALFGPDGFMPGDVILTNHTGTCGQHLNNIVVYTPAFFEGKLIGFPATPRTLDRRRRPARRRLSHRCDHELRGRHPASFDQGVQAGQTR